jgi:hypothetical protein
MLDSEKLKTLQELIGDFTLDTILPTLKHRTCIHGSILNWFLEWYFAIILVLSESSLRLKLRICQPIRPTIRIQV